MLEPRSPVCISSGKGSSNGGATDPFRPLLGLEDQDAAVDARHVCVRLGPRGRVPNAAVLTTAGNKGVMMRIV
jgi:hypothetical protein